MKNKLAVALITIASTFLYPVQSHSQDLFYRTDERVIPPRQDFGYSYSGIDDMCSGNDNVTTNTRPIISRLRKVDYFFNRQDIRFNIPGNYKFIEFSDSSYNFFFILNAQDVDTSRCTFLSGMDMITGLSLSYESEHINTKLSSLKEFDTRVETVSIGRDRNIRAYRYYWSETGCFVNYLIPLGEGYMRVSNHLKADLNNWIADCQNPQRLQAVEQQTLHLFLQSLVIK